jgi:hypothetical protein
MECSKHLKTISHKIYKFQRIRRDGSRSYVGFDDFDDFCLWYGGIPKGDKRVFEVIESGPQKLKFDIESTTCDYDRIRILVINCVKKIVTSVRKRYPVMSPLVYDMSSEIAKKVSFHVIFDRAYMRTNAHSAYLVRSVIDEIGDEAAEFVDSRVYNRVQFFRFEGSTKYGEERYKFLVGCTREQSILSKGAVTYTSNCIPVEVDYTDPMPTKSVRTLITTHSVSVDKFLRRNPEYKIRCTRNNLVVLDALQPKECLVCGRVHDSENPYLLISDLGVKFCCRRTNGKVWIT